ncbi:hypothetical protein [Kineothrix sedimenti]|uniref:Uncharacterized protein n=1 Tax=Kineothrix sedimenti TaxID=3123317 RepID=A0ABZ3F388_9FIRM
MSNSGKWYACKKDFSVPLLNHKNSKISDFVIEHNSFWWTDSNDKPQVGNVILNTPTMTVEISEKLLLECFTDVT